MANFFSSIQENTLKNFSILLQHYDRNVIEFVKLVNSKNISLPGPPLIKIILF